MLLLRENEEKKNDNAKLYPHRARMRGKPKLLPPTNEKRRIDFPSCLLLYFILFVLLRESVLWCVYCSVCCIVVLNRNNRKAESTNERFVFPNVRLYYVPKHCLEKRIRNTFWTGIYGLYTEPLCLYILNE